MEKYGLKNSGWVCGGICNAITNKNASIKGCINYGKIGTYGYRNGGIVASVCRWNNRKLYKFW